MNDNNYEQYPGFKVESVGEREVAPSEDFEKSFETGVPPFAGEQGGEMQYEQNGETQYGQATMENLYYGEAKDDGEVNDVGEQYDAGIADAATLINYGLDAAARELGVEAVVQKIKGFDASGRENPIGDLFRELGVNTPEQAELIREEGMATTANEREFREGVNNPGQKRSYEGALKALSDMKELIGEVEGADPRYAELRAGARAAGKGYFEYAVSEFGSRGLTELFSVLARQREKADEVGN
ncbi:hypothetical protein IIW29_02825, partial [Candidatus Saccharibacteria bacterium]|nr:hypothetical protein [Candidatus Saccharibacteria bacterium]